MITATGDQKKYKEMSQGVINQEGKIRMEDNHGEDHNNRIQPASTTGRMDKPE